MAGSEVPDSLGAKLGCQVWRFPVTGKQIRDSGAGGRKFAPHEEANWYTFYDVCQALLAHGEVVLKCWLLLKAAPQRSVSNPQPLAIPRPENLRGFACTVLP